MQLKCDLDNETYFVSRGRRLWEFFCPSSGCAQQSDVAKKVVGRISSRCLRNLATVV